MDSCKNKDCNICSDNICLHYAEHMDKDRYIIIGRKIVYLEGRTINQVLTEYLGFPDLTKGE